MHRWTILALSFVSALAIGVACGEDDDDRTAGAACDFAEDCYPDADLEEIRGEILCLDRVPGGYCTHLCDTDADCCAAPGECDDGRPQVCAPFESTGMRMCFLSCEAADVGDAESGNYCHDYAHPSFSCRSTGGGSENRKVCA